MKIVALTVVLLAVMQTTPPVPRKAPNQTAGSSSNVESQSNENKDAAPKPVAAQEGNPSSHKQDEGAKPRPGDAERTVSISKLPPVSVTKDGWDYLYIALTGCLILIGTGTLVLLWWQAKKTAESTAVMRRNIALQFRPRLIVRRAELEFGSLEIGGKPAKIHYTVANIGGTDGRLIKLYGSFAYWNAPGFWGNPSHGNRITPDAYAQRLDIPLSVNLRAGEDQTLTVESDQTMFDKVKFVQMRGGQNATNPSLVGQIRICAEIHYIDGEEITRKTGIYRWLDIETMRFKPVDDKEYEYAD